MVVNEEQHLDTIIVDVQCLVLRPVALVINGTGHYSCPNLCSSCGQWGWGSSGGSVTWFGTGPHHVLLVAFRFDQEDVALGQEDAGQQAKAGSQNGKNLHSHHKLAPCAEVRRNKRDPNDEEDQHAKGHALPLAGSQKTSVRWCVKFVIKENKERHLMRWMIALVWFEVYTRAALVGIENLTKSDGNACKVTRELLLFTFLWLSTCHIFAPCYIKIKLFVIFH